jgi:hypothetical protein
MLVFAHFQFGFDIWLLKIRNHDSAQYWGQIGDFIGGVLNPLLSFCALVAVLYNVSLQREELSLARKDAKEAQLIQVKQSSIFETQNFESVFFRLLDVHSRLASSAKVGSESTSKFGSDAFSFAVLRYFPTDFLTIEIFSKEEKLEILGEGCRKFLEEHNGSFGHYFRNIYQIMKYIDGLGRSSMSTGGKAMVGMEVRRTLRLYRKQRDYANMLRAQLSRDEVACLFMNCLTPQGYGLKYYVEKYSLLKTLDLSMICENKDIKDLYSHLAYADFEEMKMEDLIELVRDKHIID